MSINLFISIIIVSILTWIIFITFASNIIGMNNKKIPIISEIQCRVISKRIEYFQPFPDSINLQRNFILFDSMLRDNIELEVSILSYNKLSEGQNVIITYQGKKLISFRD